MRLKKIQTSLGVALIGVLLIAGSSLAQMAKGATKYVGNITTHNAVRSDFLTYWNQITPENESKWGSVESIRGQFSWGGVDNVKNFAEQNKIPWKFHTLVWGGQYPTWMNNLSQADQLTEITKWFDAAAAKYPNVDMIDVVNEAIKGHNPAPYKNALGGDGSTGYDWIAKAFIMARQRWPKAILIYNDYNIIEYAGDNKACLDIVAACKKLNAPIDAIGCQAHGTAGMSAATVKGYIDNLAATGLPIFITEFDIGNTNDANQKSKIQEMFTMFWNHPKIVGITYWGYLVGATWVNGTGLLNTNGTARPSLTWMQDFVKQNPNPPLDYPNFLNKYKTGIIAKKASVASNDLSKQNSIRTILTHYPNQAANGVYVSKSRTEQFSLGGQKVQENSVEFLK